MDKQKKYSIVIHDNEEGGVRQIDADRLVLLCPEMPDAISATENAASFHLMMHGHTAGAFNKAMMSALLVSLIDQFKGHGMLEMVELYAKGGVIGMTVEGGEEHE